MRTKGGRPVTTNNDTPRIFSDGASDDADAGSGTFGREWRGEPDAAWFGWENQSEPADGFPQPPFGAGDEGYPGEPETPEYPGYPEAIGYPREPEYPSGPGYAPLPGYPAGAGYVPDSGYAHDPGYPREGWYEPAFGYPRDPGYPADPGYPRDPGYPADPGYPRDPGYPGDPRHAADAQYVGYAPEPGYGRNLEGIPPMESLPEAGRAPQEFRTDQAPWPGAGFSGSAGLSGSAGRASSSLPPLSSRAAPAAPAETSDSLTAESLLNGKRSAAGSGWRHRIFRVTGGLLRLGESAADMRRRDLINRVRTPVAGGHHRVAVLSLKGGVGKTTTAVGLGATFATLRGDRVIAVDANPDRGTLSDKVRLETAATVRDLLNERDQIRRYADVRAFTTQAPSRLEVLASDRDPAVSVAFSADDYCDAALVLEHFYSICLTDCGTGLLHSAMSGVLTLADQIVVVSSPSVDGARSASATLDWLEAHDCGDLVRNGVVVLSTIRPKSKSTVDLDRLEHHFAARCRAVARIPYDPHLEEGAEVDLELLSAETADAYLTLAALVGDGLAWPRRLTSRSGLP
jgi:MinD-like ATPase involved in chromosome partitioning or flagellar assembly